MRTPAFAAAALVVCLLVGCKFQETQKPKSQEAQKSKSVVVHLSDQKLECWEDKEVIYTFLCSTGRDGMETPKKKFQIIIKYDNVGGKQYDEKGLMFVISYGPTFKLEWGSGIAIHGWPKNIATDQWCENPKLIGKERLSGGCIMLLRDDAQTLYNWIEVNTPVEIR